jgi:hypothetical protein
LTEKELKNRSLEKLHNQELHEEERACSMHGERNANMVLVGEAE